VNEKKPAKAAGKPGEEIAMNDANSTARARIDALRAGRPTGAPWIDPDVVRAMTDAQLARVLDMLEPRGRA
jgi:hypothetical protein